MTIWSDSYVPQNKNKQWRNQEFVLGGAHVSLSSPPLRSRPQIQLGGLGERCKLPQQGLGGAPAEIEFGAF